jgi:hypothetical protein
VELLHLPGVVLRAAGEYGCELRLRRDVSVEIYEQPIDMPGEDRPKLAQRAPDGLVDLQKCEPSLAIKLFRHAPFPLHADEIIRFMYWRYFFLEALIFEYT